MLTHHTDGRHKKENAVSKSGKMTYFPLISDSRTDFGEESNSEVVY